MVYKTVIEVDEDMPIHTEESLDDKFKPEATWTTANVQDESETLQEEGTLDGGILKVKTRKESDSISFKDIPILIYVNTEAREDFGKKGKLDIIRNLRSSIIFLMGFEREGINTFYDCNKCGGYIEGKIVHEEYDDIGGLAGSAGWRYKCGRCGEILYENAHTFS